MLYLGFCFLCICNIGIYRNPPKNDSQLWKEFNISITEKMKWLTFKECLIFHLFFSLVSIQKSEVLSVCTRVCACARSRERERESVGLCCVGVGWGGVTVNPETLCMNFWKLSIIAKAYIDSLKFLFSNLRFSVKWFWIWVFQVLLDFRSGFRNFIPLNWPPVG